MATININVDDDVKLQAQELFSSLGLDMDTAVNLFFRSAIDFDGIPFVIKKRYNPETEAAIRETQLGINLSESYDTIEELREALHAEDTV